MTPRAKLLAALRDARSGPLSSQDLAARAGISRSAVTTTARELRALGFSIEDGDAGMRLADGPVPLLADELTEGLGTRVIGRRVLCQARTGSTNDRVWAEAAHGAREGLAIFAEEQTKGRGRHGRAWHSPRGAGIWMSVLLRPSISAERAPLVTSLGAVAVADAILDTTGLVTKVRWPNDVYVAGRKVAGVLVESRDLSDRGPLLVLGIGVNVNLDPQQFPPELRRFATSLSHEKEAPVDRTLLARRLLQTLDRAHESLCSGDLEAIVERWRSLLDLVGERVRVKEGNRWLVGRLLDIDASEGLLLLTDLGAPRRLRLEHVAMLRPAPSGGPTPSGGPVTRG